MRQFPADSNARWFCRGMRGIFSIPALILTLSMVGFGVLCRESGISLAHAMFITGAMWALPNQVILVGAIAGGASIVTAGVGVTMAAVRFAPMIASWVTMVRSDRTQRWVLLVLSHFVAVTSYVFAAMRMPEAPPRARMAYFAGFAVTITTLNVGVTGASYVLAGALPPMLAGALFFMTPVYFLTALTRTAQITAERLALAVGVVLGPLFHLSGLPLDMVWAGLVGGGIAYCGDRFARKRS